MPASYHTIRGQINLYSGIQDIMNFLSTKNTVFKNIRTGAGGLVQQLRETAVLPEAQAQLPRPTSGGDSCPAPSPAPKAM